jgi:photosystem II stability/assembly factor-like uncharacterized protein
MRKLIFTIVCISITHSGLSQNSWNVIQTFSEDLSCVIFKDSLNGFLGSGSKILRTTDGGITWNELAIQNLNASISKIIFTSTDFGIGVGSGGATIISTNGGQTWVTDNIADALDLRSITYNDGKLFTCSVGSKIYKSVDNGENWIPIETPAFILWDIAFANDSIGYGVGLYNTSIKTTDGGENWFSVSPIIQNHSMFAIKFINQSIGYVVGGSEISKTTDGGNSWNTKYNAVGSQLNDVTTFGENIAWVVGSDKILRTDNAGENWSLQTFSPYHYILSANCVDSLICFAIGGEGSLYKTTNGGGVTSAEKNISNPESFRLYQNYPNPFNPSTEINYSLPQTDYVTLKVYDILGKEITTLVNEEQSAGNYEISFDAKNIVSGIYFYRIQAGNYSDIKKFILLR